MSGSTIGGVVGAFVGYFFGNPQLGWMIGSAIGGYVDPEQVSQFGPRLTDASQQTARDGVPIPYGYGTFPCHGNLIWCSDITEHVNESTDDGKGSGQEVTTTTYSYSRSYAIGICQGEIAGLLQIKRNGKIVWDAHTDAEIAVHYDMSPGEGLLRVITQNLRATSAKFSAISTIYNGSETQTADPTIEAHEGVGNVPGFRGLAYIVVTDDDVTELRGAVPQYEFVVSGQGAVTESSDPILEDEPLIYWKLNETSGTTAIDYSGHDRHGTYFGDYDLQGSAGVQWGPTTRTGGVEVAAAADTGVATDGIYAFETVVSITEHGESADALFWKGDEITGDSNWRLLVRDLDDPPDYTIENTDSPHLEDGVKYHLAITSDGSTTYYYVNGVQVHSVASVSVLDHLNNSVRIGSADFPNAYCFKGQQRNAALFDKYLSADRIMAHAAFGGAADWIPVPDADGWFVDRQGNTVGPGFTTIERTNPLLSDIVAAEFERVGLTSDDYDVSDLEGIEVIGYRVLPNGSGVDAALGPMMQAYFFDIAEWDGKLRCVLRGGASSLSLTMDDLAERDGEAIEWTRVQEAELLRTVTVAYIDPSAGYTPTTQKWERRAGTVQAKGEAAVEIPITATADTAASIAKKRGLVAWSETEKAKISLPYRRAGITPTDINTLTDASGEAHRIRYGQIEDDSGVRLMEVTKERGNVYGATATGVNPNNPTVPNGGGLIGPTILYAMNLPRLRTQDNQPGAYFAVTGLLPGWKGADIYISADGGVSEQFALRIMSRATMGELVTAIDADDEPITVELYDGRSVASITADQLAARQNAFAITTGVTSEVGQFQTAVESGDNYDLTDTVRGALGTTAAGHVAGDPFVMLDQAVFFHPLDISLAGKTLIVRAVSIGTANDDNDTISFVFDPQFTGPEDIEFLLDETGDKLLDEAGAYLLE